MIIKEIRISNFGSYFDETKIEFADTSTIIVGRNGTGKSKLFDAFNWVLYERVFHATRREWITDRSELITYVVNTRAARESSYTGDSRVTTSVELVVVTQAEREYRIKRKYDYIVEDVQAVTLVTHELSAAELDVDGSVRNIEYGDNANSVIVSTLPKRLSHYVFFQGETAAEIMNLGRKETFVDAMNELAKLDAYRAAVELARETKTQLNNVYVKKITKKHDGDKEFELAKRTYDKLQERASQLSRDLFAQQENLEIAEEEYQQADDKLKQFEIVSKQLEEKDRIIGKIKSLENQIRTIENQTWNQQLVEDWCFGMASKQMDYIFQVYDSLEKKGEVPTPISIEVMRRSLRENRCALCERDFETDSDTAEVIASKVSLPNLEGLTSEIQRYRHAIDEFMPRVQTIRQRIIDEKKRDEASQKELTRLYDEKKESEARRYDLSSIPDDSQSNILKLIGQRDRFSKIMQEARLEIKRLEGERQKNETELQTTSAQIQKDRSNEPELQVELRQKKLAEKVFDAISSLEEKITSTIFERIEVASNNHYQSINKANESDPGRLVLDPDRKEVFTVDDNGNEISNPNQGALTSILLAFLAGVLEVAGGEVGDPLPFVADAPISSLDGKNRLHAIATLVDAFEQSIIILKDEERDDQEDPVQSLIRSNTLIGRAYRLNRDSDTEHYKQHTRVSVLK